MKPMTCYNINPVKTLSRIANIPQSAISKKTIELYIEEDALEEEARDPYHPKKDEFWKRLNEIYYNALTSFSNDIKKYRRHV